MSYAIDVDDLYPRDAAHRYRLYFRTDDDPGIPAAAAASLSAIGAAIETLDEDARAAGLRGAVDLGIFGILDAVDERWIILPYLKGAT